MRYAIFAVVLCVFLGWNTSALADEAFEQIIDSEINKTDFSQWESQVESLSGEAKEILGINNIAQLIMRLVNGETGFVQGIWAEVSKITKDYWEKALYVLVRLTVIAAFSGLLLGLNLNDSGSLGEPTGVIGYCSAATVALSSFASLSAISVDCIGNISEWMQKVFPVLLTLLGAAGAPGTAAALQPIVMVLCNSIIELFSNIIVPIILLCGVFAALKGLFTKMQLSYFFDLGKSAIKWMIGISATIYISILSLEGIISKGTDSVSLRAVKYALDKGIPIAGNIVSGSTDLMMAASGVIKNAAGITSMLILLVIVLQPVMNLFATFIAFRVSAAICGPISDSRIPKLYSSLGDVLGWLLGTIVVVISMFVVTVGTIIQTGTLITG